jgi:hypothetical protein
LKRRTALHSESALRQVRAVAGRRRKVWCQFVLPESRGGQFGQPVVPSGKGGTIRAAITQLNNATEDAPSADVTQSATGYELAVPLDTFIDPAWRVAIPLVPQRWAAATAYSKGAIVTRRGWVAGTTPTYLCVQAGETGANEPRWPTRKGTTAADGTVVWKYIGEASVYEITSTNSDESQRVEVLVRLRELRR